MATKIDTIKLGTSEYEIDLKSTATPSVAGLTTSTLTVNGTSNLKGVSASSIQVGSTNITSSGVTATQGSDLNLNTNGADINLTAGDQGSITINASNNLTLGDIATFSPNAIIFSPDDEFTVDIHGEDVALFTIYGLDLNNGNITSVNNIKVNTINGGTPLVTSNLPLINDSNVVLTNNSLIYSVSNPSTTIKLNNKLSTFRFLEYDAPIQVSLSVSGNTLGSNAVTITITNVKTIGNYTINLYVYDIFGTKVTKKLTVSRI